MARIVFRIYEWPRFDFQTNGSGQLLDWIMPAKIIYVYIIKIFMKIIN